MRNGLAATGKTITAAALIMILVFGSFILGGNRVIKEFGIGLAGGILVDAILIRMAIVPSIMMLFGKANWWFPPGWTAYCPSCRWTPTTLWPRRCPRTRGRSRSRNWPGPSSSPSPTRTPRVAGA